jgi:peptidoglycan/xylan/chitin deacetylase (PgdA/CDA1 family)
MRAAAAALVIVAGGLAAAGDAAAAGCAKPLFLTFDTGHMGVAPRVADVLRRHDVRVTFFLASEKTLGGGSSLDAEWAPWWQARAAEGHVFGSHTFDHVYWRADRADGGFDVRPSAGPQAGVTRPMTAAQYCAELARPATRLAEITGRPTMAALFRAPGGKTSPALLAAASRCGWTHVGWSPAGFLGDELPSDRFPNDALLKKALRDIRPGDILLAHLGIWSRQDAWAPAVLEPLLTGLQARGHCFATLAGHPTLGEAARRPAPTP